MVKKIIVTGATGFVGKHTIMPLLKKGFEVHTLGRSSLGKIKGVFEHTIDLLTEEKKTQDTFNKIKPSHLLHLAWTVEPGQFWHSRENLNWVRTSLLLYESFVESGGQRIISAGTCAEYDWSNLTTESLLDEETSALKPSTLYGAAKLSLYQILSKAAEKDGISLAWGRLFFLFGEGEKPGRLVRDAVDKLLSNEPFATTSGTQVRDFMNVKNAGEAFAALCDHNASGAFNIGSGRPKKIYEILKEIELQIGNKDLLQLGQRPMPPNEPLAIVANVERLKKIWPDFLNHKLEEELRDFIKWRMIQN